MRQSQTQRVLCTSVGLFDRSMMASTRFMVEELRREREQSSLNVEELTHFIDGSEFITEKKRRICKCTRSRHTCKS